MRTVRKVGAIAVLAVVAALVTPTVALAKPGSASTTNWQLVFTVQPSVVQRDMPIVPQVVVSVEQSNGHVVNFDGPVTLAYANNPVDGATPTGTTAIATNGVATFPSLTFSDTGFGFRISASATMTNGVTVTSAPSAPFDVVDQLVHCPAKQSCQTETVASNGTSGSSVASAAASAGILTATGAALGAGGGSTLSCTSRGGVVTFNSDRPQQITVNVSNAGVSSRAQIQVCAGAPAPFVTADGSMATYNAANDDYEGLLPNCPPSKAVLCVSFRNRSSTMDTAIVLAPAGDPHITF